MTACAVNKTILKTLAELADDTVVLEAMLDGLKPDVMYQITVAAFNQVGRGTVKSDTATTDQEAAKDLQSLTSTPSDVGQLTVTWKAGERTGPTNYTVTWEERNSLVSPDYTVRGSVVVTGYGNNTHTISGLLSYWLYRVTVQPHTVKGSSKTNTSDTTRTNESAPGEVKTFNISQPPDTAVRLDLVVVCPEERQRNGPIAKFTYTSTVDGDTQVPLLSGEIQVNGDVCEGNKAVTVEAENTYHFTLRAVTSGGIEGNVTTTTKTVDPRPPKLRKSDNGTELLTAGQTTETSVTVDVCPCVVDPDQGHIVKAGCTVCVKSDEELCEPASGTTEVDSYDKIQTWKQFKNSGYTGRYRPTPKNWHETIASGPSRRRRSVLRRVARAVENGVRQYTIGANTTCDQYPETVFCNGQLPEGTNFIIIVWACTKGGCSESPDVISVQTKSPDDAAPIGGIVGGIVAVIIVLAVVIVVVIVIRRRGKSSADGDRGQHTVDLEDSLYERKSVSMILYPARVEVLHRNANLYFRQEFQELLDEAGREKYSANIGKLAVNRVKNRNPQIVPYDYTRVKLFARDENSQDYINASYITGLRSPCDYLATQAPLISTVPDFWKMVWEQKSPIVVMLCGQPVERGQPEAEEYWPSALHYPVHYGEAVVTMTSASVLPVYTVRKFTVCMNRQKELTLTHYQLSGWEDWGSSLSLDDVTDMVFTVSELTASVAGPVTVHCTEGTARTCTFIALDTLQRYVLQHALGEKVDVFSILLNIIKCRPHMMQSEDQYIYIHDVVRVMVERKMRAEQGRRAVYQNTGFRDSSLYESTYAIVQDVNVYEVLGDAKRKATSEL